MENLRIIRIVRHVVIKAIVKRTFLSLEPLSDDFSKILIYVNQATMILLSVLSSIFLGRIVEEERYHIETTEVDA